MMPAHLSLALLGLLSMLASLWTVHGNYTPMISQVCATKDFGVCCYILQSCDGSGSAEANCNSAASMSTELSRLTGVNNGSVPMVRSACNGGDCLLALDSQLFACSLDYDEQACAACEPVFGQATRGLECSVPLGILDACCYVQINDPRTGSSGFQGCKTNADCDTSLYSSVGTYECIDEACFYISGDLVCDYSFNQCSDFQATAPDLAANVKNTCNALYNGNPDAASFFPASAPGSPDTPGTAVAPSGGGATPSPTPVTSPGSSPVPTSTPSASPTVTPTATPAATSQPSSVPSASTTAAPQATPTPTTTPSPSPSSGGVQLALPPPLTKPATVWRCVSSASWSADAPHTSVGHGADTDGIWYSISAQLHIPCLSDTYRGETLSKAPFDPQEARAASPYSRQCRCGASAAAHRGPDPGRRGPDR